MRRIACSVMLVAAALGSTAWAAAEPETWEGPLLKPVPREEVFEFTQKPTVRTVGKDRYEIAFASRARCDVAVAIHDKTGKLIRHIVAGVLGSNAPEPLQKNTLDQKILWDGKNDNGEYVEEPETCKARVSLGLSPTFDKLLGWHPNDITGEVGGIGADKDGVYIWDKCGRNQIKKYTHDGEYVRTAFPWPADKLNSGKLVKRTVKEVVRYSRSGGEVMGASIGPPPGGQYGPNIGFSGAICGLGESEYRKRLCERVAVRNGMLAIGTPGHRAVKKIMLLGTDGSSRGRSIVGPTISRARDATKGFQAVEISPDGVWLYGIFNGRGSPKGTTRHAVYRLALMERGPMGPPYIGEENDSKYAAKGDNRHLNTPTGLACDMKGRLYVCDYGNNRIQVFAPGGTEGKHLKTIPCKHPRQLDIHHKTGEIYVLCFPPAVRGKKTKVTILKFGSFENPKKLAEWKPGTSAQDGFRLDSWADPPRIWLAQGVNVVAFRETKDGLEKFRDFAEDVRKAGYNFHMLSKGYREKLTAFRGGHLYYGGGKATAFRRVDPEEGKKFIPVYTEWGGLFNLDEVHAATDGYLYVRGCAWVGRFRQPTQSYADNYGKGMRGVRLRCADEVPFDYGEKLVLDARRGISLRGVIKVPSVPGGNFFNMGFAVAPSGDVLVLCENHGKVLKYQDRGELKLNEVGMRNYLAFLKDIPEFDPKVIPGVIMKGHFVFIYDGGGEIKGENVVPVLPGPSCGIRGDKWGNIYVGLGWTPVDENGRKYAFSGNRSGVLAKFPPQGGKLYGKMGLVRLEQLPNRPRDFSAGWARNLLWSLPGLSQVSAGFVCTCPQSRFDTDWYGRVFAPRAWGFHVMVLDTNGNEITRVGTYGNAESGRGPDSPVKVKGGIALAHCSFLAVDSDRWLYLNDSGNNRVVRVKLDYAKEERVALQQ